MEPDKFHRHLATILSTVLAFAPALGWPVMGLVRPILACGRRGLAGSFCRLRHGHG